MLSTGSGTQDVDITIIGGGSGGYVAAIRASQLGAKVVLVENDKLGGVCTNYGCIPTKALLRTTEFLEFLKTSQKHGITIEGYHADFASAMNRANAIANTLSGHVEFLMKKHKVDVIYGFAVMENKETVTVRARDGGLIKIRSKKTIIASGSSPIKISIEGVNGKNVITSDDAFKLAILPKSIIVVGGGAVGLEWAIIFKTFGAAVTVIEMMPQILPAEDEEVAQTLRRILEKTGIETLANSRVSKIEDTSSGLKSVTVETSEGVKKMEAEMILLATGRTPNTANMGLEKPGIIMEQGRILVNDHMQTNVPEIYAIGDVVGRFMLAHTAMQEGIVAAENAVGMDIAIDYKTVPKCVYTHPEVASVGLSEKEAKKMRDSVETATYLLRANGRAITIDQIDGLVKLVFDRKFGEILGAQIIAPEASEMIHEFAVAMKLEATAEDIAATIHAHPTLSEILREVSLRAVGKPLHG